MLTIKMGRLMENFALFIDTPPFVRHIHTGKDQFGNRNLFARHLFFILGLDTTEGN
jgi:hypothetical protein